MINTKNLEKAGYTASEWEYLFDSDIEARSWMKVVKQGSVEGPSILLEIYEYKKEGGENEFVWNPDSLPDELQVNNVTKLLELEHVLKTL